MNAKGLTMGFHVRLNVGGVREETGKESFFSSDFLQLTPEAPQIAAHSECNHPEVQNQVEELYDDNNEPMRPADTEKIPEKRDYQSSSVSTFLECGRVWTSSYLQLPYVN